MKIRIAPFLLTAFMIAACNGEKQEPPKQEIAFVQLFEWKWPDVARECEEYVGPAGYTAVQVSPPNEHVEGPAWWTRYQPVSYKLKSRGGTRAEFKDMVARCKNAGIDIYADTIINHMAGVASGKGVGGSAYSEFNYPVPYEFDDFHHCGRYEDDRIRDYQDLWEVQNCQLGTLDDLDTGKPSVQASIAAYLNDLQSLGVAGFRLDAAKHIANSELSDILRLVDGNPFVFQEVIDRGGEPINALNYVSNGMVTEFKYPTVIVEAFERGNLDALTNFWSQPGWLPNKSAIVFVDNHDIQRGHAGAGDILNYKDGASYNLAVAFMLAYPFGYPLVMSSYEFEDDGQGPPDTSPHDSSNGCGYEWVCEHRRDVIASMVRFRKTVGNAEVVNWQIVDGATLSFGRGNKGHVVINSSEQVVNLSAQTDMPAGEYRDLVSGSTIVSVDNDGRIDVSLEPFSAIAIKFGG